MKKIFILTIILALFASFIATGSCQDKPLDNTDVTDTEEPEEPAKPDDPTIPPGGDGQQKVKYLPVYNQEEYNAGAVSGDNQQYMTCFGYSESNPGRIYMGQDMGGIWVSLDAGKNWNTLRNKGLGTRFLTSLGVDPLDANRVIAVTHCALYDKMHTGYQGIYLTTDGGINWESVQPISQIAAIRKQAHVVAYAPSSKDTGKGYATRWYTVISHYTYNTVTSDDGLWYSDNGGKAWTKVRSLPVADFGELILGAKVHPANAQKVYIYGQKGLICFDDATNASGTCELLSGKNGLPDGLINGDLYISPDGTTMIMAVANKGIYKTTNGGTSWSLLYAWNIIQKCFVNPGHPDRIYATADRSSDSQIRVSKDGGMNWNSTVNSTPVPGYTGAWNTHIHGGFAWVIPDPENADRAFAQGNAKHHQTDNGGTNWYPSNGYFNGNQFSGVNYEQMFDPVNPDRFFYFMVDVGILYTNNRGKWFAKDHINTTTLGLESKTCHAGAIHPDASTGIVLASVQTASKGKLIRSTDNGATWTVVRDALVGRRVISFDQQNPDYCYQWRERSSDAGQTWVEMTNMPAGFVFAGMSYTDGRVIYAIGSNSATGYEIYRSNDRGNSWTKVISSPKRLLSSNDATFFTFRVHPKNHDILFTSYGNDGTICKWDLSQPNGKQQTLFSLTDQEAGSYIGCFAIDRRFPDVMYAISYRDYTGKKMFMSQDGGATWKNISNFTQTIHGGLEVSPVTGEVFISGANGTRVMLPPYATSNTAFESTAVESPYIDKSYQ